MRLAGGQRYGTERARLSLLAASTGRRSAAAAHRALAVVLVADAVVQLAAAAPLHHDVHMLGILERLLEARRVERAAQLAHGVHLAPHGRQVVAALLLRQRRVVQNLPCHRPSAVRHRACASLSLGSQHRPRRSHAPSASEADLAVHAPPGACKPVYFVTFAGARYGVCAARAGAADCARGFARHALRPV